METKNLNVLDEVRGPNLNQRGIDLLMGLAAVYRQPGDVIKDADLRVNSEILKLRDSEHLNAFIDREFSERDLKSLKWLGISASPDRKELDWLIKNHLQELGYIQNVHPVGEYGISLTGWKLIEEQRAPNSRSRDAFIAMPFRDDYLPLLNQALYPGVANAGYEPVRIDRRHHNNRIDDEIIASIRKSRFLVADLSEQRGGIYFEAGYALGLGLPVVWTVKRSALDEVHFDNRQYNFLVWDEDKFDDLAKRLTSRIEATIGRPF